MKKVIKYISGFIFTFLLLFSVFKIVRVDASDVPFIVTNIEVKDKSSGTIVNDVSINLGTITNDIVFSNKDDYIKYNLTFKNDSEENYTIKSITDDNDLSNLEYTYDDLSNVKINALEEKTFELTITYKLESSSVNISNKKVNLTLIYEDEQGNIQNGSITNPKTGDEIIKYIILFIISVIGLSLTLMNKKKIKKYLTIIVITILLIPLSIKADESIFQIVFNNKITAYEFDVSFNTNEGSNINPLKIISGGKVTKPSDPEKENNVFMGWYKDSDFINEFDFENDTISKDTVIYAKWMNGNIVKYNANGGKYTNNTTIKPIKYNITTGEITKYSHTENVDDTGKQLDVYGNYWNSTNIVGTDRGDTSKPHVVTIPGAETITVDIYYNSEGVNWDKVYVIEGAHPNPETYSLEQIQALVIHEFGDIQTGTYIVNGNELTNMGHETLIINGDSVTFDFVSDDMYCEDGYGYYAIITGTGKVIEPESIYEEPTNGSKMFAGWYKDINTTDGQEFNLNSITGIVEVYAKWMYKITYNSNGGDLANTEEYIKVGDGITSLPQPQKDESTLLGWYDSDDNKIEVGYIPTDNLVLKAKWETNKYTISFDSKGAGDIDSITKEYNTEIGELPNPTKNNYAFGGWYLDETYEDKLTENTKVLENKTYIARWVPIYNITYNANGGKFNNNETINTTRYANDILRFKKVSHTVNVDDTGKLLATYGARWSNPQIAGSNRGDTNKAHVISIPGADSLDIDIYYNGESANLDWVTIWEGSNPNKTAQFDFSSGITDGQKLGGVQTGSYTVNGNSLTNMGYSHFTINNDSVTFGFRSDSSGYGKGYGYYAIVSAAIDNREHLDAYLDPIRDGATFVGWYKDPACTQEFNIDEINGDIEVYAKWVYRIEFDPNGGTVTPAYKDVTIGSRLTGLPTPTKNLHSFDGWFTEKDGGEQITNNYIPISDMKLYAHYTKLPTWTLSFVTNGGSRVEDIEILRGGQIGTLPTSTKENFLLLGWYKEQGMLNRVLPTTIPEADTTYYANWIEYDVDPSNINVTTISDYICPNNMNITVGDNIVCKRAETLHQETCLNQRGFCSYSNLNMHTLNSIVTYGNCGTRGTIKSGDAFTCDVNGDGKFNELTERFYYMSTYYNTVTKEYEDDTAVLVYYNAVTDGLTSNTVMHAYNANGYNYFGPVTLREELPTTEQWSNVSLKNTERQLLYENLTTVSNSYQGGLSYFSYEGYAARLPHYAEILVACDTNLNDIVQVNKTGTLSKCEYLVENTVYTAPMTLDSSATPFSWGSHVENPSKDSNFIREIDSSNLYMAQNTNVSGLQFLVRPVIDVPFSRIDY